MLIARANTSSPRWMLYRGFRIVINPVFESTEQRLERGDYRSKVTGYYFCIWRPVGEKGFRRIKGESEDYLTLEAALNNAQGTVDAIVDSLE